MTGSPKYREDLYEGLTYLQHRFVQEYLLDPSDNKGAAIRAGYSETSAKAIAEDLLANPKIIDIIDRHQAKVREKYRVTQDRIVQELIAIAFFSPTDLISYDDDGNPFIDLKNLPPHLKSALNEVVITTETGKKNSKITKIGLAKTADKLAAIEKLGKHLGMFKEQVEHSGKLSLEQLVQEAKALEEKQKESVEPSS